MRFMTSAVMALAIMCMFSISDARAQHYVTGKLGAGIQAEDTNTRDNATVYGIEAGYDFGSTRLGLGYSRNDTGAAGGADVGDVDLNALELNGYLEPYQFGAWTPYLKTGLMYGVADGSGVSDDHGFLFQVGGGIQYDINKNWALLTEYNYVRSLSIDVNTNRATDERFDSHVVQVGVRRNF